MKYWCWLYVLTLGCKHAEPSPVRDFQVRAAKLFHPCVNTPNPQFMPQNFGINCFLDVRLCFTGTKEFLIAKKQSGSVKIVD
jgi:hypothetical protein